jgi:hypothetical protein
MEPVWGYEYLHEREWRQICFDMCMPCVTLGNMTSKGNFINIFKRLGMFHRTCLISLLMSFTVHREAPLSWSKRYLGVELGKEGLKTCMGTGCLCMVPYPISPGIGIFVASQRHYMNTVYSSLSGRQPNNLLCSLSCVDLCCACMLWPVAVRQHAAFLETKEREGLLRYPWESEYSTMRRNAPGVETTICFLLGAKETGKSTIFERLLGAAQGLEKASLPKIRVGARPMKTTESDVHFIELWDVPVVCRELITPSDHHIAVLLFNSNDKSSFEALIEMEDLVRSLKLVVVVATHHDLDTGGFGEKARLYSRAAEWTSQRGWLFLQVDVMNNTHIAMLKRHLMVS